MYTCLHRKHRVGTLSIHGPTHPLCSEPRVRLERLSVAVQVVLATVLCAPALFNLGVAIPGRPA